jgi:hypothetical protein
MAMGVRARLSVRIANALVNGASASEIATKFRECGCQAISVLAFVLAQAPSIP